MMRIQLCGRKADWDCKIEILSLTTVGTWHLEEPICQVKAEGKIGGVLLVRILAQLDPGV
jgi:hypothetical protein